MDSGAFFPQHFMSFTHSLYQLRDYGAAPLWKLFTLRFPLECPYTPLFCNISNIGLILCVHQLMREVNFDAFTERKGSQYYDKGITENITHSQKNSCTSNGPSAQL